MSSVQIVDPTPAPRRKPLRTLRQVRAEMAETYWRMKYYEVDSQVGARLVFTLTQLARLIEVSELELRVQALEAEVEHDKTSNRTATGENQAAS